MRGRMEEASGGWMKVNCNRAFSMIKGETKKCAAGMRVVIRKGDGKVISGVACKVKVCSNIEAEAVAIREGMELAKRMRIKKIEVENDSEILYKRCIGKENMTNWKMEPYVQDIQMLKDCFEEVKWSKVSRVANKAVDWLANHVKKGMCLENWVILPPSSLVHILSRDGLPAPP